MVMQFTDPASGRYNTRSGLSDATNDDFDENGILKDGRRIRVSMQMMDSSALPQQRSSGPLVIETELRRDKNLRLDRFFYPDGSAKPRRRKTREVGPAELASFEEEDAAPHRAMDARDRAYNEYLNDLTSAWMSPEQRAQHDTQAALTDAVSAGVDPREFARDRMISDMCSAWQRKPPAFDDRAVPNYPTGAFAPVGVGLEEGDEVTFNGAPARLVRRGGWLFPEVIDIGPSRSSAPASRQAGDSRRFTADMGDAQRTAYEEMITDLENAWRKP